MGGERKSVNYLTFQTVQNLPPVPKTVTHTVHASRALLASKSLGVQVSLIPRLLESAQSALGAHLTNGEVSTLEGIK